MDALPGSPRVVVADDDEMLRKLLISCLAKAGFEVVAECADARELLALAQARSPDLVIVDRRMPPTDGLDAAIAIKDKSPHIAVVVLSADVSLEHARRLFTGVGGVGYLLKRRLAADDFVERLWGVVEGGSFVDPELVKELLSGPELGASLDSLSQRERDVLRLWAEGWSNAAIGGQLGLAMERVDELVATIRAKLLIREESADRAPPLAVLTSLATR